MRKRKKETKQYHRSWHDFYYKPTYGVYGSDIADVLEECCQDQYYTNGLDNRFMIKSKSDATLLRLKGFLNVKGQKITFTMQPKDDTVPKLAKEFRKLLPDHKVKSKCYYGGMRNFGCGEIEITHRHNECVDIDYLRNVLGDYISNGQVKDCTHFQTEMALHVPKG
jgi:hypothetical protein